MQVLSHNSPNNSKLGQSLPKPVPPQSVVTQNNLQPNKATALAQESNKIPSISQGKNNVVQQNNLVDKLDGSLPSKPPTPSLSTATSPPATSKNAEKNVPTEEIGKKQSKKNKKDNKNPKQGEKKLGKKRIPTIIGLLLLIVSLVVGVILFGNGTGLFMPRATPETTPKNIMLSNVTDKSFTVSFFTDEETIAFVKYGTSANDIKQQASDDRDQLSGVIKPYRLHHVTVRGLEANTIYYYLLGTGSRSTFDDAGDPYQIKTAVNPGSISPNNQTIYGTVSQANGQPGEGAIVFVALEGAGVLSTLVKSSGSWAVSLANAYNLNLNAYPDVNDESALSIKVQGSDLNSITNRLTTVADAQPVPEIVMGQEVSEVSDDLVAAREELLADDNFNEGDNEEDETLIDDTSDLVGSESGSLDLTGLGEKADEKIPPVIDFVVSDEDRTIDLTEVDEASGAGDIVVNSSQPIIKAKLPPNITVKIEVNSDTNIETVMETDANGDLVFDISSLEQELEPGNHTVVYTYIDPDTGEEVTESYDFTVSADSVDSNLTSDSETRTIADSEIVGNETINTESVNSEIANNDVDDSEIDSNEIADEELVSNEVAETEATSNSTTSNEIAQTLPYGSGNPYVPTDLTPTPATESARETVVSTESGTYNSGSVFGTIGLLIAGLFFVATGFWSYFLARQFENN
jgi:hypothetical protein